jgi:hypothetical protein
MGVSIRDHLVGESEPGVQVVIVELCDLGARNGTVAGEKDCSPRAPVVNNGEDAIIPSTLW